MLMGYPVDINQELENPLGHNHAKVFCDITLDKDIGFRWNKTTETYELVADLQTWKHPIPPERMLEKITQCYAQELLIMTGKEQGFEVEDQKVNDKNEVELTLTRWT